MVRDSIKIRATTSLDILLNQSFPHTNKTKQKKKVKAIKMSVRNIKKAEKTESLLGLVSRDCN